MKNNHLLSNAYRFFLGAGLALLLSAPAALAASADASASVGFTKEQVLAKADGFFGETTAGLAKAIEKLFAEQGSPNAVIYGEEVSAAIGIGVRYGQGEVELAGRAPEPIFWQGPSLGFDMGANAAKVFTLVYHLESTEDLMQRFPGVDGSFYVVAGVGVNYQQSGEMILAPIRTGVGLRAGASVGYVHYTRKKSWLPF
ncbi:DUF1134 domain-containing protein [Zhongshania aliphaticivorans]|uniref:DUF1134 domain-containing protein n=1 Tax=Zhongshania aliphaticivorans TaxID=1470434 RepID=A0A127M3X1_9GAMM|nr:DUF1134 domain-containing protein [Zhongshania aliphaticivorans]AMO67939.1 hypothetical protein AZF00_06305 [Zhongshania aliphaticivorans]|tara:strand:- start:59255 stop:59851 length:597 start_codon:yes stop_codon:yes gene_type:complete